MPPSPLPPTDPFPREFAPPPRSAARAPGASRRWLRRGAYGIAACVFALALSNRIGPARLSPPSERHMALTIGVWRAPDPAARGRVSGHDRYAEAWKEAAPPEYDVVESASLVELARRGVACVVVSDARRLGNAQLDALERYLRDGGGLVVAGAIGVMDPAGHEVGFEPMQRFLEVSDVRLVRAAAAKEDAATGASQTSEPRLRTWQRGSLTAEMSPGEELPLGRGAIALGLPVEATPPAAGRDTNESGNGAQAALGWFDGDRPTGLAGARTLERGAGRLVWIAAHPADRVNRLPGLPSQYDPMARLVRGAVAWASRQPMLEILPWPGAAPFAATWDSDTRPSHEPPPREIAALQAELAAHAAHARSTAGRAVFSLPSRLPAVDRRALRDYGERLLRDQGAWVASESEVSRWALVRSGLIAAFEQPSEDSLLIYVSNRSRQRLEGAVLRVHANRVLGAAHLHRQELRSDEAAPTTATLHLAHGAPSFDLELPPLDAGTQRAYEIGLESASGATRAELARAQRRERPPAR